MVRRPGLYRNALPKCRWAFASLLPHAILRPREKEKSNIMATLGHNRKMLGAECMADMLEAYGVTHVFHVPAVLRKDLRGDGDAHQDQAAARAQRGDRGLHGRRLRPRLRQARHLHGAGDRRAQSRRRPARRLARAFAGDRLHRRPRAEDQVPPGLSGGRRRAGVRAGDQVERHGRRRERAFPTWCGRRSAPRPPARPGRCICSSAATKARSTATKARWSR